MNNDFNGIQIWNFLPFWNSLVAFFQNEKTNKPGPNLILTKFLQGLPLLHNNKAAQPALPARGVREGDADQLHDHLTGPTRPAAEHRGSEGEARPGRD